MKAKFCTLGVVAMLLISGCRQETAPPADTPAPPAESHATSPAVGTAPAAAPAESEVTPVAAIGGAAPAWKDLAGVDDKPHSLEELKDAKAVAVVFTCNTCPVAVAYEDRLEALSKDYADKGFKLVAINVNKDERNSLPAMKERATEKGFTFAYLFDPSQQIARAYGATCTPHAFLLDQDRKLVYAGAIDDEMNAEAVKHHSLREAVDAVLAGKPPEVATTKQFGCGIRYE